MSSNDPRDSSLETRITLPKTWHKESFDGLNSAGMFVSGLIMVTRNRFLAWPGVIAGINGLINQHPLRSKEAGKGPLSTLVLSILALGATYLPLFLVNTNPNIQQ